MFDNDISHKWFHLYMPYAKIYWNPNQHYVKRNRVGRVISLKSTFHHPTDRLRSFLSYILYLFLGTDLKLGTMAASVFLFSIMSCREAETKSPREPAERRAATVILYASRFFNIIVPKPSSSSIFHCYLYFFP